MGGGCISLSPSLAGLPSKHLLKGSRKRLKMVVLFEQSPSVFTSLIIKLIDKKTALNSKDVTVMGAYSSAGRASGS